jgi:hypothetical protein
MNNELRYFYSSPSIIKIMMWRMRWARIVAPMEEKRNAYRLLAGMTEGKTPLRRQNLNDGSCRDRMEW